jgi:two-component system cell cycle sensor histidine kinase/response regulator CckA
MPRAKRPKPAQVEPLAQPESYTAAPPLADTGPFGTETVLVVDDESMVRRLVRLQLESLGYHVIEAATGAAALGLLNVEALPVDLLLGDVTMPGMNGRELAHRATAIRGDLRIILMSGYSSDPEVLRDVAAGAFPFLDKPYARRDLALLVRSVLDGA